MAVLATGACQLGCGSANTEGLGLSDHRAGAGERTGESETQPPPVDYFSADALATRDSLSETCALTTLPLREEQRPVDVMLVLDNSASMESELDAVERHVNVNFASILEQSGVDYRLILLSRHRQRARFQTPEDATSICVASPLSGLRACPWLAPVASPRFFHYSSTIDSRNSLSRILGTYSAPDETYGSTDVGWSEWLRPGAKKVFLELSDDDSALSAESFVSRLAALGPAHFKDDPTRPGFVFHSIVGLHENLENAPYAPDEPLVRDTCESPGSRVDSAGEVYQALSRMTGGLRYPLCDLSSYDAVFRSIAEDILLRTGVACSLPLPRVPSDKRLDLSRAEIVYEVAEAIEPVTLTLVESASSCGAESFWVENGRMELCPELCDSLSDAPQNRVSISFDCNALINVR